MFKFSDYLTMCREQMGVTQSDFVEELVDFEQGFGALDTTTLSRWERGASKPSLAKQTVLIQYLSNYFECIYPFIENTTTADIQKSLCATSFAALIGRHKDLVMNFSDPSNESVRL